MSTNLQNNLQLQEQYNNDHNLQQTVSYKSDVIQDQIDNDRGLAISVQSTDNNDMQLEDSGLESGKEKAQTEINTTNTDNNHDGERETNSDSSVIMLPENDTGAGHMGDPQNTRTRLKIRERVSMLLPKTMTHEDIENFITNPFLLLQKDRKKTIK